MRRLAMVAGLLLVVFSLAGAREYKIGYIYSDRVTESYEAAKEAKRTLDSTIVRFESKAESLKTEYSQAKDEYESRQLTLSEEGKRAELAEVDQRKRRYDNFLTEVYGKGGRIDQKDQELIAPIVERIDSAVSKLAADEGFAIVFDASKAGIMFAEAGLDLTDLVVEELNRAYAPVATPTGKTVYATMTVHNVNDQAAQDGTGGKVRQFVRDLISAQANTEVLSSSRVDDVLESRGIHNQELVADKAVDAGQVLAADYAIYGTVSRTDRRVQLKLSVVNVRLGTVLKEEQADFVLNREEDLRLQVSDLVRKLLTAIVKP